MMFTVQFQTAAGEHKMQAVDTTSRLKLRTHLAHFDAPIVAVYEGTSVITKTMQSQLRTYPGALGRYAREFAFMSHS